MKEALRAAGKSGGPKWTGLKKKGPGSKKHIQGLKKNVTGSKNNVRGSKRNVAGLKKKVRVEKTCFRVEKKCCPISSRREVGVRWECRHAINLSVISAASFAPKAQLRGKHIQYSKYILYHVICLIYSLNT